MPLISWTVRALFVALLIGSCSWRPEPRLKPERLIGSTPEELIARLGQPKQYQEEAATENFGFMIWPDLEGIHVLVIIKGGKSRYVSYQFKEMEPFDESKALALIGAKRPKAPPELIPRSQAKRWRPFGQYERLTINPDTKLISIGSHPSLLAKSAEESLREDGDRGEVAY